MAEKKDKTEKVEKTLTTSYNVKPLTRNDKKKIVGKFLIYFLLALGLVSAIFYLSLSLIDIFPDYVTISTADKLSEIMIQANGILLGFVGIIFAQLLSSIMDQQNVVYQRILEKTVLNASEEKKLLEFLDFRKSGLAYLAVFTFAFLLMSIFFSMASIAKNSQSLPTDTYATFGILFGPLLFTIVAVVFLMLAFIALPMKPPLEEKK
jgi:hypothetical protein